MLLMYMNHFVAPTALSVTICVKTFNEIKDTFQSMGYNHYTGCKLIENYNSVSKVFHQASAADIQKNFSFILKTF